MDVPTRVNQSRDPAIRASTVTVYYFSSAVMVVWANTIVGGFEVDKVIKLGVLLVGVYVTWYSKVVAPHSQGREVNCTVFVLSNL